MDQILELCQSIAMNIESEALANADFVEEQANFFLDLALDTHRQLLANARSEGGSLVVPFDQHGSWQIVHPIGEKAWQLLENLNLEQEYERATWFTHSSTYTFTLCLSSCALYFGNWFMNPSYLNHLAQLRSTYRTSCSRGCLRWIGWGKTHECLATAVCRECSVFGTNVKNKSYVSVCIHKPLEVCKHRLWLVDMRLSLMLWLQTKPRISSDQGALCKKHFRETIGKASEMDEAS